MSIGIPSGVVEKIAGNDLASAARLVETGSSTRCVFAPVIRLGLNSPDINKSGPKSAPSDYQPKHCVFCVVAV